MSNDLIAIMGTGPLGLWTAAALASDTKSSELHIRTGNTRGRAPAWVPESVQTAVKDGRLSWQAILTPSILTVSGGSLTVRQF